MSVMEDLSESYAIHIVQLMRTPCFRFNLFNVTAILNIISAM